MFKTLGTLLWLSLALLGCNSDDPGSGGGIGGSGIKPAVATGATLGSISGFGSIIVNGVRFDTDNASFFVNDNLISQSELRIGMNVLAAVDFSTNVAGQVNYVPSLIGPIESVNLPDKTFQSMGQTIQLGGGSSFESLSLSELAPGMVVEVSGLRNATGVIFATFIRPALDVTRFQLVGAVLSDLGDGQQFSLNGLQVNIAQADLSRISSDELEFGDKVYVTADSSSYDPVQKLLSADSVRVALEPMVAAGERVEYEGIVSTISTPFEFDVYWQPITATNQTRVEFQDGTLADLSMILLNTRVEVEGVVQADGAYQASKIILIATENSKITGVIEQIAPDTTSFVVLGQDIQVDNHTSFDGSVLTVGNYVEVDATFLGGRLVANEVEVDDQDDRALLEGPVTALDLNSDNLDIISQAIVLGAVTSFENQDDEEISRQAFIELLQVGVIVKARWDNFQSVELPPDSLEIE